MARKRQKAGDWVTMGPSPYFATCNRCGQHIDPPKLPMPIKAFVKYGEYAVELHKHCGERLSFSGDLNNAYPTKD